MTENKCEECNNDRDDFDSKDNGVTLTNDKGVKWDGGRCMHCIHSPMLSDLSEPKED